jgi:hypothetical protein
MNIDWRWHPITRVVAGLLGLALFAVAGVCLVIAFAGLRAGAWSTAATAVVAVPSLVLGRLFLIGA